MKKIQFRRKLILRAIRAAFIALFFAAGTSKSQAQAYTAPFTIAGSAVSANANGTFTSPVGFYDNVNAYSSITVGSGVTINSSSTYGGPIIGGAYSAVIGATTSSFVNQGNLNLNTNSGNYLDTVGLNQGATSVDVTNSGSITNTGLAGVLNVGSALYILSTSGNATVQNAGTLSSTGGNSQYALWMQSTSGNISLTNEQSGHISDDSGYTIYAQASTSGNVTITNDGVIDTSSGNAIDAESGTGAILFTNTGSINETGSQDAFTARTAGTITVVNSGHIAASSESGIYVEGSSGGISVTNTGSIVGLYGIGATQSGTGSINLSNSGTITASYSGLYSYFDNPSPASALTIRNTGSINSTGSGIYTYSPATVYDSGNITAATQAINVPSASSVTLAGRPIINGMIVGGSNPSSTSTLSFALNIPAANLATAQAQLNTELAAYALQNGGNYTFTIDGLTFDISNFAFNGITDDLATATAARMFAHTPGFASLGAVLDTLPTNATSTQILSALNNVPDSGLAAALAEISPRELQIFRNVAFDNNTFNAANVNNHLANRRDGLTGFDDSQMNVREGSMDPTLNAVRSHLLAFNPAPNAGLISDSADSILGGIDMNDTRVNTLPPDPWSCFIAGDVILADTSHNTNLDDADYTTGNVTGGLDYRLDQHCTVGALLAYAHTDANLDNRGSSATVDSYSPGIYASYVDGGWYANALGAYTRNAYTEDRTIDIPGLQGTNHGGTSGNQGSFNLTGGYEFQKGSFKFGPVASLQYVHLSIDSVAEQGPTALNIASQDQDSFRSLLGVEGRFSTKVDTCYGPMILTPHVSASWQHEYLDNSQGITANFTGTGGGSFTTQADTPDRDSAFVDVGLDATVAKDVTLFVDYEAQAGQENFFAQSARGGVKIGF